MSFFPQRLDLNLASGFSQFFVLSRNSMTSIRTKRRVTLHIKSWICFSCLRSSDDKWWGIIPAFIKTYIPFFMHNKTKKHLYLLGSSWNWAAFCNWNFYFSSGIVTTLLEIWYIFWPLNSNCNIFWRLGQERDNLPWKAGSIVIRDKWA